MDGGRWQSTDDLRGDILKTRRSPLPIAIRAVEFGIYSLLAMGIHACVAIPAVVARFVTDITLGYSVFQAVQPKKRADLY